MIPVDRVKAAVDIARTLRTNGFFARVQQGDDRAASLFARLVAFEANPEGRSNDYGWLRKTGGGFNIEGFADGAIVFGNDPNDRHNVLKIVTQVGSTNAGIGDAEQERREADIWFKPHALSLEEMRYLKSSFQEGEKPTAGGVTGTPATPAVNGPGREEMMNAGKWLDGYYRSTEGLQREHGLIKFRDNDPSKPEPDYEGLGAWLFDVYWNARLGGKSESEARSTVIAAIRTTDEWRARHPNG